MLINSCSGGPLGEIRNIFINYVSQKLTWGKEIKREQAVALLKQLGDLGIVLSNLVYIDQRKPDHFQLCVKGDYNIDELEIFLKKTTLSSEENQKGYLCIFKP